MPRGSRSVRRWTGAALTALVLVTLVLWYAAFTHGHEPSADPERPATSPSASRSASPPIQAPQSPPGTATPTSPVPGPAARIELAHEAYVVRRPATVRVTGTLRGRGTDAGRRVRVELWQDGTWLAFPVTAVTGAAGRFTAHVDLGSGRHRLRVVAPGSRVASALFTVTVL